MTGKEIEELRTALRPLVEAQEMLECNYPRWSVMGKAHAIRTAIILLRESHKIVGAIYANAVYGMNKESNIDLKD